MMLFPTHLWGGGVDAQPECQYDVAPDGRFLINMELACWEATVLFVLFLLPFIHPAAARPVTSHVNRFRSSGPHSRSLKGWMINSGTSNRNCKEKYQSPVPVD